MSICFSSNGLITLKKEKAKDFTDKLAELSEKYDKDTKCICYKDRILEFENYARWKFFEDCRQLIEDNVDSIEEGRLWFRCDDEDGSPDDPFLFYLMVEIVNGKVYVETMDTRLPYDWYARLYIEIEDEKNHKK